MRLRSRGFWSFRGQRKQEWDLGLHDPAVRNRLDANLEQFKKRCMEFRYLDFLKTEDTWAWLFYAQHHRLRTRLLDWTSNPLVALYYAVENILSRGTDSEHFGAVWAIKVNPKDFLSYDELKLSPLHKIDRWIMVNPPPVTHRLARQSGKFSYHPDCDAEPLNKHSRRNDEELVKIEVGKNNHNNPAGEIRRQLGIMNVHYAQMFLNPDGIARFINWEWGELQR